MPFVTDPKDFSKGWYFVYTVILYLAAIGQTLTVISNIFTPSNLNNGAVSYLLYIIEPLVLVIFVVIEILAMKNRDAKKAKIALYGFAGYMGILVLLLIVVLISALSATVKAALLVLVSIDLAVFFIFIAFGAMKVYKALGGEVPATANVYSAYNNA